MFGKGKSKRHLNIGEDLFIDIIPVSLFKTNCVIIKDLSANDVALFDPGAEGELILEEIKKFGDFNLKYIFATHAHLDHIGHVGFFKEKFPDAKFLLHEGDLFFLTENPFSRFAKRIKAYPCPMPDEFIKDGDKIKMGKLEFEIIHTPGHSPGSVCIYEPDVKIVLTGDTLFRGSAGRTDLIFGNEEQLKISIRKLLSRLSDDTTVLPGHFDISTIGEERRHNSFINKIYNENASCPLHDSF
ncbi:MAG: MBL fold metallo-hydrolase [Persephonella sp.]|nr:MAG: MBL fold metallo-hydrolase [Persephonella sp.]RUM59136.1 MAG: MBL fold metallo-hydrolase [Persephonella sp.]